MTTMNEERAGFDRASAAQSAPAGEREAFEAWFDESVKPSVSYGSPDILRRSNLPAFQAGAAWQRSQSAGVPEGLSLDLRDIHGALAAAHSAFVYRGQSTSCEYALTRVAKALHEVANALHVGDREDE